MQSRRLKRRRLRDERTWWLLVTVAAAGAFAWYAGRALWFIATLTFASLAGPPPSQIEWWGALALKTAFTAFFASVFVSFAVVGMTSVGELLKRIGRRGGTSR